MHHGPFPIRVWRLLGGLGMTPLGVLLVAMSMPERFTCSEQTGECRVERPLRAPVSFSRELLRGVHVVQKRGSKGGIFGEPIIDFTNGAVTMRQVDPPQAASMARTVNDAIAGRTPIDVSLRESWWPIAFFCFMVAAGLGLVATALRGIGRYRLDHDRGRGVLAVTSTLLGVPLSSAAVSTRDVVDVEVEWRRDKDLFHGRHAVGDTEGRLALVTAQGERRLLVASYHRGYTLHRRAATELRALLGCPPRAPGVEARLEGDALAHHPQPGALVGRYFSAAWIGMCCGSLLGMALYALVGLALGLLRLKDPVDENALVFGAGGGAVAGITLALYLSYPRPPR